MQPLRSLPTTSFLRVAAILPLFTAAAVATIAACGDTINNNGATCGAGTRLENGTCVAVTDATTPVTDGGEEVDGGTTDAGDLNAEDPTPDDPCPVKEGPNHYIFNCDAKCGAVDPRCEPSYCSTVDDFPEFAPENGYSSTRLTIFGPSLSGSRKSDFNRVTVRLPRNLSETHRCFGTLTKKSKFEDPTIPRRNPRPKAMVFIAGIWAAEALGISETMNDYSPSAARVRFGKYSLQFSHGRRMSSSTFTYFFDPIAPDVMPLPDNDVFREYSKCAIYDRSALAAAERVKGGYNSYNGMYLFSDKKIAATNIEFDLANSGGSIYNESALYPLKDCP